MHTRIISKPRGLFGRKQHAASREYLDRSQSYPLPRSRRKPASGSQFSFRAHAHFRGGFIRTLSTKHSRKVSFPTLPPPNILPESRLTSLLRTPTDDEREQHPCLKPGCNKIFTHLHKLQRHYRDAHGKPQYDCPYPDCTRKGPRGFARKDNMRQHHRLVHNKHLDPGEVPRRKRGASG